jgi:gluconolactonase
VPVQQELTPHPDPAVKATPGTVRTAGSCEHLTRRITSTEFDGSITVLMDRFQGRRLNAPKDIVDMSPGGSAARPGTCSS